MKSKNGESFWDRRFVNPIRNLLVFSIFWPILFIPDTFYSGGRFLIYFGSFLPYESAHRKARRSINVAMTMHRGLFEYENGRAPESTFDP